MRRIDDDIASLVELISIVGSNIEIKRIYSNNEPMQMYQVLSKIKIDVELLAQSAEDIELQYSVFSDSDELQSLQRFCDVEFNFIDVLFSVSPGIKQLKVSSRERGRLTGEGQLTRQPSQAEMREALDFLQTLCNEIRQKIAAFIRENYKVTDRPDGS